jgi:hypothetical protein
LRRCATRRAGQIDGGRAPITRGTGMWGWSASSVGVERGGGGDRVEGGLGVDRQAGQAGVPALGHQHREPDACFGEVGEPELLAQGGGAGPIEVAGELDQGFSVRAWTGGRSRKRLPGGAAAPGSGRGHGRRGRQPAAAGPIHPGPGGSAEIRIGANLTWATPRRGCMVNVLGTSQLGSGRPLPAASRE